VLADMVACGSCREPGMEGVSSRSGSSLRDVKFQCLLLLLTDGILS
jgi:hypothetical protein